MMTNQIKDVTGALVEKKLMGFERTLVAEWNYDKLASRIQTALESTMIEFDKDIDRTSNVELRKKLRRIRKLAAQFTKALADFSTAELATLVSRSNYENYIGFAMRTIPKSVEFPSTSKRIQNDAMFVNDFADAAIDSLKYQKGKWRNSELKKIRIARGVAIMNIYEEAFGVKSTINNFQSGDARPKNFTPFMLFYQLMVHLFFGEKTTPNLTDILTEARSQRYALGSKD